MSGNCSPAPLFSLQGLFCLLFFIDMTWPGFPTNFTVFYCLFIFIFIFFLCQVVSYSIKISNQADCHVLWRKVTLILHLRAYLECKMLTINAKVKNIKYLPSTQTSQCTMWNIILVLFQHMKWHCQDTAKFSTWNSLSSLASQLKMLLVSWCCIQMLTYKSAISRCLCLSMFQHHSKLLRGWDNLAMGCCCNTLSYS